MLSNVIPVVIIKLNSRIINKLLITEVNFNKIDKKTLEILVIHYIFIYNVGKQHKIYLEIKIAFKRTQFEKSFNNCTLH